MTTKTPLSIGLIGLGEAAQLIHLPLLADNPGYSIDAMSDVSSSALEALADRYNVPKRYADASDLINDADLDAVFILTPDHLHADQLTQAIKAEKHVFIEKPVCLNEDQIAPLLELNRSNSKVVFVGYMRRYAPAFLALKDNLPNAEDIRHVRVRDIIREAPFFARQTRQALKPGDVDPAVIAEGKTRTEAMIRTAMGNAAPDQMRAYQVLTGLSSHSFSAMRELFGMPKGVKFADQRNGETVMAVFDYGHFSALYEAVISDIAEFDAAIEVLTNTTRLQATYDTPYIRHLPGNLHITRSDDANTGKQTFGPFYEDAFAVELEAFLDAVASGGGHKTTLEDAAHDLRLFKEVGRHFLS